MYQIQSTFRLTGYLDTRIGGRAENQDSCGFSDTPLGALTVVCDGMGGMNGGSTASSLAVQTLIQVISSAEEGAAPVETILRAVAEANGSIIETGRSNPDLQGMGTTMTLLLLRPECAYVCYVGDSRVYQIRAGKKIFRTFDDSVVFRLVESGAITEEEARVAGNSNIITKALGIAETVECSVECLPYDKNDRFVLCTDGFWGPLPEPRLLELIGKREDDLDIVFERTLNKVESAAKEWHPNHYDNLTAAVIDVKQNSKKRSPMERKLKWTTICLSVLLLLSLGMLIPAYLRGNIIEQAIRSQSAASQARETADSLKSLAERLGQEAKSAKDVANQAEQDVRDAILNDGKGGESKELSKKAKDLLKQASKEEKELKRVARKAQKASDKADRLQSRARSRLDAAQGIISAVNLLKMQMTETDVQKDSTIKQD